jgi:SAM-dependent methyltransferase
MQQNWWENFFHGIALDFWRAAISDEQTRVEADFIQKQLQLPVNAKVLDVPCGNARLSIELASHGNALIGVDIATEFVDEAKTKSNARDLTIELHNRDMRDLPWSAEFDGAFCFGNSFGYLDDQGNADFLKAVSRALKPGSRFVIDAPAIAECILPNFKSSRSLEVAGITASIENRYDCAQGRIFTDFTFTQDGLVDKRPSSQRIYAYRELAKLLTEAEFEVVHAFGSLEEEPFELGDQRLLLVCEKRPGENNTTKPLSRESKG